MLKVSARHTDISIGSLTNGLFEDLGGFEAFCNMEASYSIAILSALACGPVRVSHEDHGAFIGHLAQNSGRLTACLLTKDAEHRAQFWRSVARLSKSTLDGVAG